MISSCLDALGIIYWAFSIQMFGNGNPISNKFMMEKFMTFMEPKKKHIMNKTIKDKL